MMTAPNNLDMEVIRGAQAAVRRYSDGVSDTVDVLEDAHASLCALLSILGFDPEGSEVERCFTHIPVMYRDGANYKSYGTIVLRGAITPAQIEELRDCMVTSFDVPQFKPELLGMEHHAYTEGGWNDEWDHPWHDAFLGDIEILANSHTYGDHIQYAGTVAEFLGKVRAASKRNWDEDR